MNFADTGPGIQPQQTEKIFEPFQSNFEGGTGLGLAIVYQIVQAHEGKVWARSEVGKGTNFVLRLRRVEQAEQTGQIVVSSPAGTELPDAVRLSMGGGKRG
jgi:signal transduction histidine kinase